ncbi:MAG: TlpA family protein disulfide reductase [Acidobacteriia bacterium]|nr:TlpA family protein disulfide reductase [Terriglobia bacterium]
MPVPKTVSPAALAAFLAAVVLSLACTHEATVKAAVKADKDRKAAPNFTLADVNGQKVQLSDYKGKVVLLDFWATWCGPCKVEIPWFMEFEQTYKNKGFAVLGVSMDDDGWTVVKPYLQQLKVNYRIVLGNDKVGELYGGVDSLPTTFLIDRQGKIAATHVGLAGGKDDFKNEIVNLLGPAEAPHAGLLPPSRGALAFFTRAN